MNDLAGQTAVITGAGDGLGRAIALKFASVRANIALSDTYAPLDTATAVERLGARCVPLAADLSSRAQAEAMIAAALRAFGGIHVLVYTARSGGPPEPVQAISEEAWDQVLGANLKSAFLCVQAALPALREHGSGSVVFVSSTTNRGAAASNAVHYTCSNYGLMGLTRHLVDDLAGTGIRVNCVCPGPVETLSLAPTGTPASHRQLDRATPLHRLGQVDDVAETVLFVAGSSARHMHGAILDVDGGFYLSGT
jgi:NAD(P)-dependent dehydrogenase (short-subunit alcohol dehydrogenase family)